MRTFLHLLRSLMWVCALGLAHAQSGLVIIANKDVPVDSITAEQAAQIFLKQQQLWSNGKPMQPIDAREGSGLREDFYSKVMRRTNAQLRAYWARQTFTGTALPPREGGGSEDIARWVAATPGAIGYVQHKDVEGNVKVLLTTTH